MEAKTKKKMSAVAIATAVVLILAGTMAYLSDASGTIRNVFDDEHVRVQINESGIENTDNGDKPYTVIPGTKEGKDPTITVDTDTDAYVFAVVKDTINSHGPTLVDYTIDSNWVELDKSGLTEKSIKKYIDILNNKAGGTLTVDPTDENTKIYYRIVHGEELEEGTTDHNVAGHRFTYNVLTGENGGQISYPASLTNDDMLILAGINEDEDKALIFQTYAVQMEPWCPEGEVAGADATTATQKGYAKDAWNGAVVNVTGVSLDQSTLEMEVGDEDVTLTATIAPANASNKKVTWESSDETVATVDENGVVTAVGAGTATITVKTEDGGKTATCEVTVTEPEPPKGNIKWAVQLHSNDGTTTVFWPAMGTDVYGSKCNGERCIHNDSWNRIKANPSDYTQCIEAGCTKTVTIDETSNNSVFSGHFHTEVIGGFWGADGFGELLESSVDWSSTGNNSDPTYYNTLDAIKAGSDLPDGATLEFLGKKELEESKPTKESRIICREGRGSYICYWLADADKNSTDKAYWINLQGNIEVFKVHINSGGIPWGIAPKFSY